MALASAGAEPLAPLARHPDPAVRLGVVLALRRLGSPDLAAFLEDSSDRVVLEAVRAIHDESVEEALPQVARMIDGVAGEDPPLVLRVLNASSRVGDAEAPARLARFAQDGRAAPEMRLEALALLETWGAPSLRDRVTNAHQPRAARPDEGAKAALAACVPALLLDTDAAVRGRAARLARVLDLRSCEGTLESLARDEGGDAAARSEALLALEAFGAAALLECVETSLRSDHSELRRCAREVLARIDPEAACDVLETVLRDGGLADCQAALQTLAEISHPDARALLREQVQAWRRGVLAKGLWLDVDEAARSSGDPDLAALLPERQIPEQPGEGLGAFDLCLEGGDAEHGRKVFFEDESAQCLRCHRIDGVGGEAGPDLSQIGATSRRRELLESLVFPNARYSEGYTFINLFLDDGQVMSGRFLRETEDLVEISDADGVLHQVPLSRIRARREGLSSMPDGLAAGISLRELRDLVEFLATRR